MLATALRRPESYVAVVGASGGIGLALVQCILERYHAKLVATSRRPAEAAALIDLAGRWPGRVNPIACDITDAESVRGMAESAKGVHGGKGLDMLINAAGILHDQSRGIMPEKNLAGVKPENFERVMAINALGPVLTTQALQAQLNRGAVIGNVSARVGSISDNRLGGWWSYRMSKAALNMATRNTALELKKKDIIVVSLHPGTVDSQLSLPFQRTVPEGKLFTPAFTANAFLDIMEGLTSKESGRFFDYAGKPVEF
mmetsp:Transcript_9298/g.16767  ORF Transcript_9298/g.16767 Transcript_9298/m.16767 type:complete len:257 (-) Transcript_9298:48-818(-)